MINAIFNLHFVHYLFIYFITRIYLFICYIFDYFFFHCTMLLDQKNFDLQGFSWLQLHYSSNPLQREFKCTRKHCKRCYDREYYLSTWRVIADDYSDWLQNKLNNLLPHTWYLIFLNTIIPLITGHLFISLVIMP